MNDTASGRILTYFGYGTLLGESHMRQNYPSAKSIGLAFYDQSDLGFWRYADASEGGCTIVHNPDGILFGVLYELQPQDMDKLLHVGGLAEWYEARVIDATRVTGGRVRAITLRVQGNRGPWAPPASYASLITEGAKEAELPKAYRARLDDIIAAAQRQS